MSMRRRLTVVACMLLLGVCMASCEKSRPGRLRVVGSGGPAAQPVTGKGLVVVVHGWIEKGAGDWPQDMAVEIHKSVDANEWCCGYYDWRKQARTVNPTEAAEHARDAAGPELAEQIIRLGGDWRHIHLIGHSCGCWVVSDAAKILARKTKADIHLTLLDAYVPVFWQESSLADVNTADANCWADHYYTRDYTLGWTQHNLTFAHNVDITSIDYGLKDHNFPWKWYYATIAGRYPESGFFGKHKVVSMVDAMEYGFARSREAAGAQGWRQSLKLATGAKAVKLKKK